MKSNDPTFSQWASRPLFTACGALQTPALQRPAIDPKAWPAQWVPDSADCKKLQDWSKAPLSFPDASPALTLQHRA